MTHYLNILFSNKEILHSQFLETDLGRLYLAIPFEALAKRVPVPAQARSGIGCKPWFDVKGGIALQFLKHNLGLSDEKLIERLNTDWAMQLFCGVSLKPGERIRDKDIVGSWRKYLGFHMDLNGMQQELSSYWKPYMNHTNIGGQDATCYESGIRYPTDSKLLWECCQKVYDMNQRTRKMFKLRKIRCNFGKYKK